MAEQSYFLKKIITFWIRKVFISFQDFVGENKDFFCMKSSQVLQERGIYLTHDLDIDLFDIEGLFIGELLVTNECKTLLFQTVKQSWLGGKSADLKKAQN